MARRNNPRNLRSSLWSNPMFCLYCAKKEAVSSWTNRLLGAKSPFSFINKITMKKKKNNKKKDQGIQKQARSVVLSSSYNNTIIPLQSKAATMQVQSQLNKLKAKNKKTLLKTQKNNKSFQKSSFRKFLSPR